MLRGQAQQRLHLNPRALEPPLGLRPTASPTAVWLPGLPTRPAAVYSAACPQLTLKHQPARSRATPLQSAPHPGSHTGRRALKSSPTPWPPCRVTRGHPELRCPHSFSKRNSFTGSSPPPPPTGSSSPPWLLKDRHRSAHWSGHSCPICLAKEDALKPSPGANLHHLQSRTLVRS